VGVQATFFTEYDLPGQNKEHVLSGTQAKARAFVNRYILGNVNAEPPTKDSASAKPN
jgi:hypothetical protein